jgi:hypothetical protein
MVAFKYDGGSAARREETVKKPRLTDRRLCVVIEED